VISSFPILLPYFFGLLRYNDVKYEDWEEDVYSMYTVADYSL